MHFSHFCKNYKIYPCTFHIFVGIARYTHSLFAFL